LQLKHDKENRKESFFALFRRLIKIENLTAGTFESMIMQEKLIREDKECLLIVNDFLLQYYKQSSAVCLGGAGSSEDVVAEVFNSNKTKSALVFPNLPVKLSTLCSLRLENYVRCIGGATVNDDNKSIPCKNVWRINLNDPVKIWTETAPMNHKRCVLVLLNFVIV